MSNRKRPNSWVDLTGDDDENLPPQRKQVRVSGVSAQPRSSQSLSSSNLSSQRDSWVASTAPVGEEDEIIDLSQDRDEGFGWDCVGVIEDKIVGVRYYNGLATPGEQVMIRREPGNPYDSNAIRINNVQEVQIGHIPRALAAKLAPLMDSRAIVLEGILTGEKGSFDCPIRLRVFGPSEPVARAQLEAEMKAKRMPIKKQGVAAPKVPKAAVPPPQRKQMGYQSSSQASSSQPEPVPEVDISHFVENSERFRPRDAEKIVEAWGLGEDALSKMPMADQPEGLSSTLLPYQRQGLAWMLEKENPVLPVPGSKNIVQLWKRSETGQNVFQNIATQFKTATPPVLAKGGILADDMGLGKTLQIISVILEGGPGTTLIIAPVSVMSNWAQQIERHVKKDSPLKVMTYHGSNRKRMTYRDFGEYNVVITSYGTLSAECFPRGSKTPVKTPDKDGLFSMKWARVVLDEGHGIRNPATKSAIAAANLLAVSRWVLSGTPIVNTIKDLYSMLKFIGITGGLERMEIFNAVLTRPLAHGTPHADLILQSIMRTMCLRRKKDMKFVDLKLPELSEYVHRITFRKDEREKYEALQAEAKGMVDRFQSGKAKKGENMYRHVLEVLLRMRQVCCHWKLCGTRVSDLLALLENDDVVALTKENRAALQVLLQLSIDSQDECAICLETLHNPVITACKHVFGQECIERTIDLQHKCPMCRAELADKECLVHPAVEEESHADEEIDIDTRSSKTEALMSILTASRRDPLSKVVIFSQWTSFLNIIQHQLEEAGMKFARIDGSMKATVRDAAMTALETDPDTRILLASLSVCSVGLNLVAADTVILADSWWAPAIEDQAVDRVHRLGQTRPCTVWRLIMEESIEERVLDIQAEKRLLVGKAFQEKSKGGKEKVTRMGDILKLLA
ncbi:putative SWI/SNF-related matrix-associated actin-dependent regulator of chromatin subfamily A member 3-like 1 [Mollisia scopiformis]|uniref:Putative SWI/SNF-related matrix-associated actin-dependent regulator of chromatin subfamily A member 3-like 1 n=1 Tax=Mollisia scopiformis TaxID=149040 RepID=A0A194X8D4_MOLSC|nr:putative SWI/SNF-related matrix-associated actin-dependent regulator of chromatin subfamily A member 3-like 1 [Mollisia scopiformis]KUJ16374.1 putative SWI/SNF-related matrix-associated actin-dependent regulator of chromatin subfamily A member 3-like 1 [Mollisia scopiformis]